MLKDNYFCYGCSSGGNVLDFIAKIEKVSMFEAISKYVEITSTDDISSDIKFTFYKQQEDPFLLERAEKYYKSLPETKEWSSDHYLVKERMFDVTTIVKTGIKAIQDGEYGIILPVYDNGEFRGFIKRKTQGDSTNKYINNKGFLRRNTLCGNYERNYLYITEGYLDWLRLVQYGCDNAVAIMGWKITPEQIAKIKTKSITHVISALDNTDTGIKGTTELERHFKVIRFQFPIGVKDIGDMTQFQFRKARLDTLDMMKGI